MRVDKRTKTKKILPFLTDELVNELLEKLPEVDLDKSIMNMTIEEFSTIIEDENAFIDKLIKEKYLFTAFGKLKSFKRQMKEITNFIKMYEIKQSQDEKQAAIGIIFPDLVSRMLLTVTKYLSLHSLEEAKHIKVSEYLIIMQDEASSLMYQRNYSDILSKKADLKNKNKRK